MAVLKKQGTKKKPMTEILSIILSSALTRQDDFILTVETDPETGTRRIIVMTGKFITPCMLRKLIGQVESQRDEGSTMLSRKWDPAPAG